jgi:hypothetical protein
MLPDRQTQLVVHILGSEKLMKKEIRFKNFKN